MNNLEKHVFIKNECEALCEELSECIEKLIIIRPFLDNLIKVLNDEEL